MDENQNVGSAPQPKKEIHWRLVGFVVAAVLTLVFVLSNLDEVEIRFLWLEATTSQWVSLVAAFVLGVVSDRLFVGIRRRRRKDS